MQDTDMAGLSERERILDPSAFKHWKEPRPLRCDALERMIEEHADRGGKWAEKALAQYEMLTASCFQLDREAAFMGGVKHRVVVRG